MLNPWEAAKRFRQTDPLASRRIGQEGTTPVGEERETPSAAPTDIGGSAREQAFQQSVDEAGQIGTRATQAAGQLADLERAAAQRREQEALREQEEARRQEWEANQQYQQQNFGPGGQPFQVTGELSDSRRDVLERAGGFLGSRYQLGGRTVKGVDCSGLVMAVYNKAGFNITQHSAAWQGRNIPGVRTSFNNLEPGDIVAWPDGSHIAIYAGNGNIIDATSRRGTAHRPLWTSPQNVFGIKLKFPGE
jgi:cell wall-associated NlpC family hydrolase